MLSPNFFDVYSLTESINLIPNNYGLINQMKIFKNKGVRTRTIAIELRNNTLSLLPAVPVGGPATMAERGYRHIKTFTIPHFPYEAIISAEETQGVRAFGQQTELEAMAPVVNDRLEEMKINHSQTLENLRMGALKGIIIDASGATLYNLYTEFGITPKVVNFALNNSNTEVREKCAEVVRHIEDNLQGDMFDGVVCFVSSGFYDALVRHASVKEAYKYYMQAQNLSGDFRKGFTFGGITFIEYRIKFKEMEPIAANEGHAFPTGTADTFRTYFAPADFIETVNTIGLEMYAKLTKIENDRGYKIHTQSNALPICMRPGVLVKVTAS